MRNQQQRRRAGDRREDSVSFAGGEGRRDACERRQPVTGDDDWLAYGCGIAQDCWGASEDESSDE